MLWVFVLIALYAWVIKPLTEWLTKPGGGFFRRVALWPVRKSASAVERLMREQIAALKRYLAANMTPLVLLFDQWAEVTNRLAGTLGDMSEQIYTALWTLNHETIPRKINAALVPIRNVLTNHTNRLDALEDLNRRVGNAIVDGLRLLPWGAGGSYVANFQRWIASYVHLWQYVFGQVQTRLNTLWDTRVPDLERAVNILRERLDDIDIPNLQGIRNRLERLEDQAYDLLPARIRDLEVAVDALTELVTGVSGASLLELFTRVQVLEQQMAELLGTEIAPLLQRVTALETKVQEWIDEGLDTLFDRVAELERQLREDVETRFRTLELKVDSLADAILGEISADFDLIVGRIVALEMQIENEILPELRRLAGILEPAALAALILLTLKNAAPNLFCRNVTEATKAACAVEDQWMDDLLALLFLTVGSLSIVEFAKAMAPVTELVTGDVHDWIVEN